MSVKIEKQKVVEEVNYQELVSVLMNKPENEQQSVHIMMFTEVKMKKRGVPQEVQNFPTIKKLSSRIYRLSVYSTRVNTERSKDGLEKDFESQKLRGRTKVSPFVFVSDNNPNTYYLGVEPTENFKTQFNYYDENCNPFLDEQGNEDETMIELINQYKYKSSGKPNTQVQEKEVKFITPKIENIWKISMGGVVYVRNDI